jgi:hypothetical protein
MQFEVTVHRVDPLDDCQPDSLLQPEDLRPWQERDDQQEPNWLAVTQVGTVTVEAADEQLAAAKGWIACAGVERQKRLVEQRAPRLIVDAQTDIWAIQR